MTEVRIDRERDGWHFFSEDPKLIGDSFAKVTSKAFASYPATVSAAREAGHVINNAGWLHKLLSWNWNSHAMDGYPWWEIANDGCPAFVKLSHKRGDSGAEVESLEMCRAWDNLAAGDFYQRDWTDDGIPFCREGEVYWSGWWFETIAERNRFLDWCKANHANTPVVY